MQKSCVRVNDLRKKKTLQKLERKCQFVVRLKANKYYQELLCSLSFYIKLLNLLNLQGLCGRLLAPGRFLTSSPWSRPLTNSRPHPIPSVIFAVIVIVQSITFRLVSAFAKVAGLAKPSFSITWLVDLDWSIVGLIGWLSQLVGQLLVQLVDAFDIVLAIFFLSGSRWNHSPEQLLIHIKPSPGLHLLFARSSRPCRPSSIRSPPASTMLENSCIGTPAITSLFQQRITLFLQQKINE